MAANDFAGAVMLDLTQAKISRDSDGVVLLNSKDAIKVEWDVPYQSHRDIYEWIQKQRLFLKDQNVANVLLDGLWRSSDYEITVSGKGSSSSTKVVQVFRRGYAQKAEDGEAFVDSGSDVATTEDLSFFVTFPNVAPQKIQPVMAELVARGTVEDPKFGKTPLTGRYVYSQVDDTMASDGIHNIRVSLKKLAAVTDPITELKDLKHTEKRWTNILKNGELECGREQGAEMVWRGLDPESRANVMDGITAQPSGFVNANIETVNPWTGTAVVGTLYAWQSEGGDSDWNDTKRNLTVEAREVFNMSTSNYESALELGWVTQSWEPELPVEFEKQSDGTATLTVRAIDHRWKNLKHDIFHSPAANWVQDRHMNPEGKGAGSVVTARGVPTTASLAIAAARDPDEGNLIGSVSVGQSGNEAVIQLQQSEIWDYLTYSDPPTNETPDGIDDPTESDETTNANNRVSARKNTWKRVDPEKLADHLIWARLYRKGDGDENFLVSFVSAPIHPDGARDVVVYLVDDREGSGGIDTAWMSSESYIETTQQPPDEVYSLTAPPASVWPTGASTEVGAPRPDDGRYWRLVWKEIESHVTLTSEAAARTVDPANDGVGEEGSDPSWRVLVGSHSKPFRKGLFIGNRVSGLAYSPWFADSIKGMTSITASDILTTIIGSVGSLGGS